MAAVAHPVVADRQREQGRECTHGVKMTDVAVVVAAQLRPDM